MTEDVSNYHDLVYKFESKIDKDLISTNTNANADAFIKLLSDSVRFCLVEVKDIMKKHKWTIKQQTKTEIEVDIDEVGTYLFHIKNSSRLGNFITNVTKKC